MRRDGADLAGIVLIKPAAGRRRPFWLSSVGMEPGSAGRQLDADRLGAAGDPAPRRRAGRGGHGRRCCRRAPAAGLIIALGGFGALGITGIVVGVIAVVAARGAAGPVATGENLRGCGRGRS